MPSDVALDPKTATSTSPTCTTTASARSTRRRTSSRPSPAAASGATPATTARPRRRRLAGPAGIAVVPEPGGKVTIFIADYYNGHVRAVGPDGIIRDLSDEGREAFGAPTRVAFAAAARLALRRRFEPGPRRAADHPAHRAEPGAAAAGHAAAEGGRMTEPVKDPASVSATDGLLGWTLRSCGRTAARGAAGGAAAVGDRARRAAAVAARDRHRLRARRQSRFRPGSQPWLPSAAHARQSLRAARRRRRRRRACCRS